MSTIDDQYIKALLDEVNALKDKEESFINLIEKQKILILKYQEFTNKQKEVIKLLEEQIDAGSKED